MLRLFHLQAYAPELYLLEGGIDSFGGSSQGSTRPHSRTPELYNSISNSLSMIHNLLLINILEKYNNFKFLGNRFVSNFFQLIWILFHNNTKLTFKCFRNDSLIESNSCSITEILFGFDRQHNFIDLTSVLKYKFR